MSRDLMPARVRPATVALAVYVAALGGYQLSRSAALHQELSFSARFVSALTESKWIGASPGPWLLVDDDARNIFALSSVLERRGMRVLTATTGSEAVALVESNPEIAIVLMDIMMPQMDGYQTIGVIRGNPSFRRLPIIALTAKAMKGDREKCLEAGASDYLAKPVNTEQLLLAIRMWLHR